jgi:hypothetical protein
MRGRRRAQSTSLADEPVPLAKRGPSFTVPEGDCVYVGRVTYPYLRLPPGSLAQAKAAAEPMFHEKGSRTLGVLLYLPTGPLVPFEESVDKPKKGDQTHDEDIVAEAHHRQCVTDLAKF